MSIRASGLVGGLAAVLVATGCDRASPIERQYREQRASGTEQRDASLPVAGDPLVERIEGTYANNDVKYDVVLQEFQTKWGGANRDRRYTIELSEGDNRLYATTIWGSREFRFSSDPTRTNYPEGHDLSKCTKEQLWDIYESVRSQKK